MNHETNKRQACPGEVWASDYVNAIVLVLSKLPGNYWVSHNVLVLHGHDTHFSTGVTRKVNLASANACWERLS